MRKHEKNNFGLWETQEERLKRFTKIPPAKKLELLEELHRMVVKTSSKRMLKLMLKLKESRSLGRFRSSEWK